VTRFKGHAKVFAGVSFDAFEEFDVHIGDPSRSLEESLSIGVFTNCFEELADEYLHSLVIDHV